MDHHELSDDETRSLIDYARRKYAEERYPLAPALRPIRELLAMLDTTRERMPAPKPPGEPSLALRKKKRR